MEMRTVNRALVVIAAVLVGAVIYWLRNLLEPFAMAVFLLIMVDGVARHLRRYLPFLPAWSALPTAILLITVAFLVSMWVMVNGVSTFVAQLGGFSSRLDRLIADAAGLAHVRVAPTVNQLVQQLNPQQYAGPVLLVMQGAVSSTLFVLVYLGFLIASRQGFARKARFLFTSHDSREEAIEVFRRIRTGVESYLWVQTVTGLVIAAGCMAAMLLVGLHNVVFWTFMIFLLAYIPIIGGLVAGLAPPLYALLQFQTYWQALVLLVVIQAMLFVMGNIVLPKMQAESQNLDPVVVLISLAFWGSLWGLTGAFLSTPLTVMAIAILSEFKGARWIASLMSGDGDPYPVEPRPLHH